MSSTNDEAVCTARQQVEVRSCREILATLDEEGKLEGLPFMPEMLAFCGRRIEVERRAGRTCVVGHGFRRMRSAVFLQDVRCDGKHHGNCERACLIFWKEAWLKPVQSGAVRATGNHRDEAVAAQKLAWLVTRRADRYVCQSTELAAATTAIARWDIRPWLGEVWRGELALRVFAGMVLRSLLRRVLGWRRDKRLAGSAKAPSRGQLQLREGEWIRVKSSAEIRASLDEKGRNRGLVFQPTMNKAIGGRYQVAFPVRRMIIETTGKMIELSNTVALEGVTCEGACVAHCPRKEYLFWRESWLRRDGTQPAGMLADGAVAADGAQEGLEALALTGIGMAPQGPILDMPE